MPVVAHSFLALSLALPLALFGGAATLAQGLRPPCGTAAEPQFPALEESPVPAVWRESELSRLNWTPAACFGWSGRTRLAAAVAGTFTFAGGMDRLLDRMGAFSRFKFIPYWSNAARDWRPLAHEAGLVGAARSSADSDLFAADFVPGRAYAYFQVGAPGRTTYRLTVRERSAHRVVLATENTSAIRLAFLPLFDPGALQSVIFVERRGPDSWRYFQAVRAGDGTSLLALGDPPHTPTGSAPSIATLPALRQRARR